MRATTADTNDTTEWLARVEALAPLIQKWRDEGERQRQMPRPLFEALRDAGFFRLLVPERYGGSELPTTAWLHVIEELAAEDGATAWNVMIANEAATIAARLPEQGCDEILADPLSVLAVSARQTDAVADPVEGGYKIRGRWQLASGCTHADWVSAAFVAPPRPPISYFMRTSECRILDTWDSAGMRATASNDFAVEDVFVPDYRHTGSPPPQGIGPLYRVPVMVSGSLDVGAVTLGIAREALNVFADMASSRKRTREEAVFAEQPAVHNLVGDAVVKHRAARALLQQAASEVWSVTTTEMEFTEERVAKYRVAGAFAAKVAAEVVDTIYTAAGSFSIYRVNKLERCFRDVHTLTQHGAVSQAVVAAAGRSFLALEPAQRFSSVR